MRRYLKIILIVFITFVLIPTQLLWYFIPITRNKIWVIPRIWHKTVLRILNIRVVIKGKKKGEKGKPVLYVANHCSYLDIVVLGSILPASFISKDDVAQWPVFGFLAKLQGTFFIKRNALYAQQQQKEMTSLINNGTSLILFPEGTTTDGLSTLPFKSTLFSTASDLNIDVQPIAILYQTINGSQFSKKNNKNIAWYIDKETGDNPDLAPHLWNLLNLKKARVVVEFLSIIQTKQCESRKELAHHAQIVISEKINTQRRD